MAENRIQPAGPKHGDGALSNWRIAELERRVGRLEAFVLGQLVTIALAVATTVFAALGLPGGT